MVESLLQAASPPPRAAALAQLERTLALLTEIPAAGLVVAEILLLSAGVTSRYVFHRPLVWSDELASALFLWLALLGAVIALQRGEHMRLTVLVNAAPPGLRGWMEALGSAIVIACMLALLAPAEQYIEDQWVVTTPALQIHDGVRVAAILLGAVLMSCVAVIRLFRFATPAQAAGAVILVAAGAAGLWAVQDVIAPWGNIDLVLFFVVLVGFCVAIGTPIAFAFGAATLAYLAVTTDTPLSTVVNRIDEGMSELILLAVPLFVFLGVLIEMMGLARALVNFMVALLGHVRGGLSYVLLAAMYLVSGISGSKAADMAAVAPSLFPDMRRRGAHPGELVAQLAASGAMSETIPPSLVLITIGSSCGVSIAGLFTGGMLPAAAGALALVLVCRYRSRGDDLRGARRARFGHMLRTGAVAAPALVLPFLIRAAVVKGVATATEVSTVGIAYTVVVGFLVYRQFDGRRLYPMLVSTAALSGAILLIIGMATAMAWALTQSGFSQQLVEAMIHMPGGKAGFLGVSIVVFAVLGSLLEGIPAIVLFGPLLFPAARAIGVNDVHYAMTVVLAMGLGLFAPPFGIGFYFSCAIGGATPDEAMGRVWPYLGALLLAVIAVAAIPWLSTGFL
ncbi:MAG: TRAP transporter large permease subunit [Acidisphaera sp.]|nr:TRAP transporter large permease subunit [Acidisphaera sp.]